MILRILVTLSVTNRDYSRIANTIIKFKTSKIPDTKTTLVKDLKRRGIMIDVGTCMLF